MGLAVLGAAFSQVGCNRNEGLSMTSGPANHPELSNRVPSQPYESRLYEAIEALTSELSPELVLQKVTDLSRDLAQSSYSALGVLGGSGTLIQFLTSGIG
jgi:hypothetical protein